MKLADDPAPQWMSLLIPRTPDWVEPVRRRAQQALRQHLRPESAAAFAANLGLIEGPRKRTRFPAELYAEIQALLLSPACAAAFVEPTRLAFAWAARERDASIRTLAFAHPDINPQLFTLAATDTAASIRRLAFEKLGPTEAFLFDPAAGLRR